MLPFVGIGSTAGATANYSTLNDAGDAGLEGCVGIPDGGKDVVYSYTPSVDGTIEVWLEEVPDDESVCADPLNASGCTPKTIHVTTKCPDTADFAGCVGGVDYLAQGTPFPTRLPVDVTAGTTYLVIVSGYNSQEEGPYKLLVDWAEGSGMDASDATDGMDATDGADAADAMDGGDAVDAADGADAMDGGDAVDGVDTMDSGTTTGTDGADDPAMDGTDPTDGTDAMDGMTTGGTTDGGTATDSGTTGTDGMSTTGSDT